MPKTLDTWCKLRMEDGSRRGNRRLCGNLLAGKAFAIEGRLLLVGGRCDSACPQTPQAALTKTTKQTQFRRTPMKSTPSNDEPRSVDLAVEIRGLCCAPPDSVTPSGAAYPHRAGNQDSRHMKASDSFVAHAFLPAVSPFVATSSPVVAQALTVPRRDSSRRLGAVQPKIAKQTQSRRTRVETTTSRRRTPAPTARQRCGTGQPGSRGLLETGQSFYGWYCVPQPGRSFPRSARLQRPSGVWGGVTAGRPWRHVSPIENDQTNPISPNSSGINVSNLHFSRAFRRPALNGLCLYGRTAVSAHS